MMNLLSYVGMNLQSEVCLWTLLGLMRTIFDATLFKVNANLKQVWQMTMPEELSMPIQRVIRTMISGIILVQCFTVYIYLASYIVLLYPVFLEERPTLVLPWLLLTAVRKLLCELTSLTLGLGICVLLGTSKPPCIKFLVSKFATIAPAFYMWTLVYSYYRTLAVASAFKTFPAMIPETGPDYSLELAIRRRRTKSLFGEDLLRKKIVSGLYSEQPSFIITKDINTKLDNTTSLSTNSSKSSTKEPSIEKYGEKTQLVPSNKFIDTGTYEDWFGSEILVPRSDRILEQFVVMLLRIGAYLGQDGTESIKSQMFNSTENATWVTREMMSSEISDTPPLVGNSRKRTASYLREYPQIFMKRLSTDTYADNNISQIITENTAANIRNRQTSKASDNRFEIDNFYVNDRGEIKIKENISEITDTAVPLPSIDENNGQPTGDDSMILPITEESLYTIRDSPEGNSSAVINTGETENNKVLGNKNDENNEAENNASNSKQKDNK